MSAVVNIKFVTVRNDLAPEWIDVTLSNGQVVRYRKETGNHPTKRPVSDGGSET